MKKKVLVLDDDLDVLEAITAILSGENFKVFPISQTHNIFKNIDDHKPDIILLDYILDGLTGAEICRQIKTHPSTRDIPVIIISAYKTNMQSLKHFGCDHFIAKPFTLLQLVEGVKNTLDTSFNKANNIFLR